MKYKRLKGMLINEKIYLVILLLMGLLLTACAAPPHSVSASEETAEGAVTPMFKSLPLPTPTPFIDVLLATALKLFDDGKYEEAILQYTAIISFEPKNFDAQLGLGQSYRKNKQSDNAVGPLKTALSIRAESKPAAIELGYAYLDTGAYAETEKLARELLGERMPDLNAPTPTTLPDGEETTPTPTMPLSDEDGEALTLLLLSLGGQERTEEVQALLQNDAFHEYLNETITDDDVLYVGSYNVDGDRDGKGVGIYPGGYLYVGTYHENLRVGQGKWYWNKGYFIGGWMNDMPNGAGEEMRDIDQKLIGTWKDGLENGEMEWWIYNTGHPHPLHYKFLCENGQIISRISDPMNSGVKLFALCLGCPKEDGWWLDAFNVTPEPRGLPPFQGESVTVLSDPYFEQFIN